VINTWLAAVLVMATVASAGVPTLPAEGVLARTVEIEPAPGAVVYSGDRFYGGPLRVVGTGDGLGLVETIEPEDYLLGIREVPFAWPDEALRTQVVAARTYLAFTLAQGRSSSGRLYGYDICASSACQVYAGLGDLDGAGGSRWRAAVEATAGEILLYEGRPAQALYSSTSGGRTRESEDVFPGLDVPYLSAVDSPGEGSPFDTWSYIVSAGHLTDLLRQARLISGSVQSVHVERVPDGEGPWIVVIEADGRTQRIPTWQFRGLINRAAAAVMPEILPARRPDGRRYPQTLLSGTFEIRRQVEIKTISEERLRYQETYYWIEGGGWGHQVGLSQYGAKAMAEAGSGYREILAHYYGGLTPQPGGEWLDRPVAVGLAAGEDTLELRPTGPVTVTIDGTKIEQPLLGSWQFSRQGSRLRVIPPVGLGLAPQIDQTRIDYLPGGETLRFSVTAPAEVTVSTISGGFSPHRTSLGVVDAGDFEIPLRELLAGRRDRGAVIVIAAVSPAGSARRTLVIVPER
jgi:stage II sporulation protein D